MTLNPNYSWDGNKATKCLLGKKREGAVIIGDSNINCNSLEIDPIIVNILLIVKANKTMILMVIVDGNVVKVMNYIMMNV